MEMIGAFVKVYTKAGNCFNGIVKKWSSEIGVELINSQGEHIVILNLDAIESYSFLEKNNDVVKAVIDNDEPKHVAGNINSLVELRKMKAKEDQERVKKILTRKEPETNGVEYVDQFSFLQRLKKHSTK